MTAITSMATRLAALGAYFAVDTHEAGRVPGAPWRPMGELLEDPGVAAARVDAVRAYLEAAGRLPAGTVRRRVAASVMQLGLAARTLSPVFALAVLGRRLPPLGLHELYWQPTPGSLFALSFPGLESLESLAPGEPDGSLRAAVESLTADLCDVAGSFGVAPRILRGNVASALNGARISLTAAQPELAGRAREELDRLLHGPTLDGTAQTAADGRFQRRSCCLIYQAAPGSRGPVCGDCILAPISLASRPTSAASPLVRRSPTPR
jgi:hypothetical protein